MLKILFIGDIVGSIARQGLTRILPGLIKENKIDLVIANAENAAHGSGITEKIIDELEAAGVNCFTTGDHALLRSHQEKLYARPNIVRPANYPPGVSGHGYALIPIGGKNVLLINLAGRVFMKKAFDCPFRKLDEILANIDLRANNISAIIVDIHAEATSEKVSFLHYADGRVSAVLGTHTHVQTADEKVTEKGTAFISDVGMVGAEDSSLGISKEGIIRTFLTQVKETHGIPEKGPVIMNAVLLSFSSATLAARSIKRIQKRTTI